MIWNILSPKEQVITLPSMMNWSSAYQFISQSVDGNCDARWSRVVLDFGNLAFVEPVGVVILSTLIEYLRRAGVRVKYQGVENGSRPNRYLDDSGFFKHYLERDIYPRSTLRATTVPLHVVRPDHVQQYLGYRLMPWLAQSVGLSQESLDAVRACLEEIFHNVEDHSEVKLGCAFAQHFPNKNEMQVAISDFGVGIPTVVRRVRADVLDQQALSLACKEGFSTKSNVRNRGAGLPTLIRYVTTRNKGTVLIASGGATLSAVHAPQGEPKVTPRLAKGHYPGTLVRVILRTDTFEAVAADVEPERFEW